MNLKKHIFKQNHQINLIDKFIKLDDRVIGGGLTATMLNGKFLPVN